jgi:hypothetical protein
MRNSCEKTDSGRYFLKYVCVCLMRLIQFIMYICRCIALVKIIIISYRKCHIIYKKTNKTTNELKQAAHSSGIKRFLTPSLDACRTHTRGWCATPCGKTKRSPRNTKPVIYSCGKTRQKTRLAARGSTPGGRTRFFSWRQKPLDAAWVGGECAACLIDDTNLQ